MNIEPFLAAAVLVGCLSPSPAETPPVRTAPLERGGDLLPPATRALVVPGTAEADPSLLDLLGELALCTGQKLLMDDPTRQYLRTTSLPLLAATEVPAGEVYTFAEAILFHHGVYLAPVKGGHVPMLGVYVPNVGRGQTPMLRMNWVSVPPETISHYLDHPALLVETAVHLPSTEVRQLATTMRQLWPDQYTQAMVPVGDHGVLIRGTGRDVARTVAFLLRMDEQATPRRPAEGAAPPPPAKEQGG
ncbi:MAG: hypothetical protein AB1726_10270 [Planctomycetota bacterium]